MNLFKVPCSVQLGLINVGSLAMSACLIPALLAGLWTGKKLVDSIPQHAFQAMVLGLAAASAAWLLAG